MPQHKTEQPSVEITSHHRSAGSSAFPDISDPNYFISPSKVYHQRCQSTENDEIEQQGKIGTQFDKELEDENSGPIQIDMLGNKPITDECEEEEYSERSPTASTPVSERNNYQKFEDVIVTETRYCTVCTLEQPVRAKHCRDCGKCVALHDHHCPWLGICIGERNRRQFWFYLFFECALL